MTKFDPYTFDPTAFMSGQMESKLWMVDTLYQVALANGYVTTWETRGAWSAYIYAGWYGLSNVLLNAHGSLPKPNSVLSFDLDPHATLGAMVLNEAFEWEGTFRAITADVNKIDWPLAEAPIGYGRPDVVINTSVEHIDGREWFDNIPPGTLVVLQSNDMEHLDEHTNTVKSEDEFVAQYPLNTLLFKGTKNFDYRTWSFNRFMIIGTK